MTPRTRDTTATQRRFDNLRRLIAALSLSQMEAADICDFLQFSPSGARKYIRELHESRIIEVARYIDGTEKYLGRPLYKLTADQALLAAFVAQLNPLCPAAPRKPSAKLDLPVAAGRSFHIMADDTHYTVRASRAPAVRDSLVAALFGAAGKATP